MAFLELLNLAEIAAPDAVARNSAAYIHGLAEASAIAYADRDAHLADPRVSPVPVDRLISKAYAREVAGRIRADSVAMPPGESVVLTGSLLPLLYALLNQLENIGCIISCPTLLAYSDWDMFKDNGVAVALTVQSHMSFNNETPAILTDFAFPKVRCQLFFFAHGLSSYTVITHTLPDGVMRQTMPI
jgi:hypothetical protein